MKWFRDNLRHGAKLALFALAVQIVLSLGHIHLDDLQQHRAGVPCDICAVMAMAGTALFAAPPILLLPDAAEFAYAAVKAEFDHLDAVSGAQQPRGPPAS
jgi:hypothetical protein